MKLVWMNIENALKSLDTIVCKSIGWIVNEDKKHISVAGHISHGNSVNEICG